MRCVCFLDSHLLKNATQGLTQWMEQIISASLMAKVCSLKNRPLELFKQIQLWFLSRELSSYQPVSSVHVLSMVLERVVFQLQIHLYDIDFLDSFKSVFPHPGSSKEIAFVSLMDDIHWSADRGSATFQLLFKPFFLDNVAKVGLGRIFLQWFKPFLSDKVGNVWIPLVYLWAAGGKPSYQNPLFIWQDW